MIRRIALLTLTLTAASLVCAEAAQAQWGTLRGRFLYDGSAPAPAKLAVTKDIEVCGQHNLVDESLVVGADGGVANVVLYLRSKPAQVHEEYANLPAEVTFDNEHCRFVPHVLTMTTSQTVILHNSDPVAHNSNLQPIPGLPVNPLIAAGGQATYKFVTEPILPVPITCNIHPWMKGYIVARSNPYVTVSAADGTFEIKNLPVGSLEFQAWHERPGYLAAGDWEKGRFTFEIKEGDNDLGDIKLSPELMQPK